MQKEDSNVNMLTNKNHKISNVVKDTNITFTKITHEFENTLLQYLDSKVTQHIMKNKKFLDSYIPKTKAL